MMYQLNYGVRTRFALTIATAIFVAVFFPIFFFFFPPSENVNITFLVGFIAVAMALNLWIDNSNFKKLKGASVTENGLTLGDEHVSWECVNSCERFGPHIRNSQKERAVISNYWSGVFIKFENKEFAVYSSAKNYKRLLNDLKHRDVPLNNA